MAPKKTASSSTMSQSPFSIGNCEVSIEANKYACESDENSLQITVSRNVKIRISVKDSSKSEERVRSEKDALRGGEFLFMLINPKDIQSSNKTHLQEVLDMYTTELPAMKYAANTGKRSTFLERCVMNGKYCTLLLRSERDSEEVVAAITYQIVPADTQYAEIPLAAVLSKYQRKGVGRILFTELRKRFQSVGVGSIICWGDKESEGFWHKQGFESIAEVNVKGRTRRLPLKADIRKALCFPGCSMLMMLHLEKYNSAQYAHSLELNILSQLNTKPADENIAPFRIPAALPNCVNASNQITCAEISHRELLVKNGVLEKGAWCQDGEKGYTESNNLVCAGESSKIAVDNTKKCSCSTQGSRAKRVWEASLSSLKSKKVKGGHLVGCQSGCDFNSVSKSGGDGSYYHTCPSDTPGNSSLLELPPTNPSTSTCKGNIADSCAPYEIISEASLRKEHLLDKQCFKIMLMNIADDVKKEKLSKVITDLGGIVTTDGSTSTHVITGKVRATLNFCTALCSGAWVLSPHWLKESFRQGKFMDELSYILNDEEYKMDYISELRTAVIRARANPGALLKGYDVCLVTSGDLSVRSLTAIVKSAGGNVIDRLSRATEPSKTIFLANEEDIEEAMLAVNKGIWTFNSDWLMSCIMRQELDLEAPQFAESL